MSAVTIRNLSSETHWALRALANKNKCSTEAQIRTILDKAVKPIAAVGLGSAIHAFATQHGGVDLKTVRDRTPALDNAAVFE